MSIVFWYGSRKYTTETHQQRNSTEEHLQDLVAGHPEVSRRLATLTLQALRLACRSGRRDADGHVAICENGVSVLAVPFAYEESPVLRGTRGIGVGGALLLQDIAYFAQQEAEALTGVDAPEAAQDTTS